MPIPRLTELATKATVKHHPQELKKLLNEGYGFPPKVIEEVRGYLRDIKVSDIKKAIKKKQCVANLAIMKEYIKNSMAWSENQIQVNLDKKMHLFSSREHQDDVYQFKLRHIQYLIRVHTAQYKSHQVILENLPLDVTIRQFTQTWRSDYDKNNEDYAEVIAKITASDDLIEGEFMSQVDDYIIQHLL